MATPRRASRLAILPSTLRLALWRLRQTWRLLLGAGLGIVVAVTIVCAVPLFSKVATSAGLRGAFDAMPDGNNVTVNALTDDLSVNNIHNMGSLIDGSLKRRLGQYLNPGQQFSIQLSSMPVISVSDGASTRDVNETTMQVIGYDEAQVASHAALYAGRLPHAGAKNPEIALTKATADSLRASVGSTVLLNSAHNPSLATDAQKVPFTVVGIITIQDDDVFFHRVYFEPQPIGQSAFLYRAIASNDDLLSLVQLPSIAGSSGSSTPTQFYWYYSLDQAHLDAEEISTVLSQATALQIELPNALIGMPGSPRGSVFGNAFTTLFDYQLRINALQVPLTFLSLLILALVLFFVSVMSEIVVDRQADVIAVLRSRGASRSQVLLSLVVQSLGLGVIALVVGPLLALVAVMVLTRFALASPYQSSLNLLTDDLWRAVYDVRWFAILAVVAAVGAMIIAINRAVTDNVLSMRRESARTTRKPFWQRLNLDIVAAVIAVTGYILYSLVLNRVDAATQTQLGFLGLVTPVFILFAGTLLFFRLYPLLLSVAAWVAGRARGAVPVLALAQMARSPRQSVRTMLLLAFSTAFTIFSLIFVASQTQHLRDVATFNAGADFSGALPYKVTPLQTVADNMAPYTQIPGVASVAVGYLSALPPGAGVVYYTQQVMAVDADHYAQTATWDSRNSTQSLDSLMAQLVSHRGDAKAHDDVPAILSGSLWDALHLSPGMHFSLAVPGYNGGKMPFVALARVEHIEGIYDSPQFSSGGVLVDYQSYATVFTQDVGTAPPAPNYIWLRSANDAASIARVRYELTDGKQRLASLADRRALIEKLITDPLQVDLSGILAVGTIAAVVLSLVGVLTASWLSAHSRLTNFAMLRALGMSPTQIAGVLIWEQSIVYGIALVLGAMLGALLSVMVLPILAFANTSTDRGDLVGAVNLPAIQMLVPTGPLSLAIGALVAICLVAMVLMTLVVARPSVSATLRLNED